MERKYKGNDLKYETKNDVYDFQQHGTIRSSGEIIFIGKMNMDEALIDQTNLLRNWKQISETSKLGTKKDKNKKWNTFDSINALYGGQKLILNSEYF